MNEKNFKTTDLCDNFPDRTIASGNGSLKSFGQRKNFFGMIHTIRCNENNPFVKRALEKDGKGKVLVIDGGGSLRVALLGDNLGAIAVRNKWEGIIVNGCIRDSSEVNKLDIGVLALDTNPVRSGKNDEGEENTLVKFAGLSFAPGEFIYCDEDGIVVSKFRLI